MKLEPKNLLKIEFMKFSDSLDEHVFISYPALGIGQCKSQSQTSTWNVNLPGVVPRLFKVIP